jgi:hypothetical protein
MFVLVVVVMGAMLMPARQAGEGGPPEAAQQSSPRPVAEHLDDGGGEVLAELEDFFLIQRPQPVDGTSLVLPASQRVEIIQQRAAQAGYAIETVIATVPDPIDSHARWTFDRYVDSIRRGVEQCEFVLDRFGPQHWWPQPSRSGAAAGESSSAPGHANQPAGEVATATAKDRHRHEHEPGVVLFRKRSAVNEGRLLVLLLVTETATEGVRPGALLSALDVAARLDGSHAPLRLLGPSFSGSVSSLELALSAWTGSCAGDACSVRIVSGSADVLSNRDRLLAINQKDGTRVSFAATVPPASVQVRALAEYLRSITPWRSRATRIALLVESNTAFGNNLRSEWVKSKGDRIAIDVLPFPMHVSRLRYLAETNRTGARSGFLPSLPRDASPLKSDPQAHFDDALPSMTPEPTSSSAELALRNILRTIQHGHVDYVGILATDARDRLFLAGEVARHAPNAVPFTLSTDLLYLHPDHNTALRGAIVVSAYPLHLDQQQRALHREGQPRLLFPNNGSEGVFNATLALLAYDASGKPLSPDAPALVDYSPPGGGPRVPQVWISVVGSSGIWPVEHVNWFESAGGATTTAAERAYVFPLRDRGSDVPRAVVSPSRWSMAGFVLLLLAAAWQVALYWLPTWASRSHGLRELAKRLGHNHVLRDCTVRGHPSALRYLCSTLISLVALYAATLPLLVVWLMAKLTSTRTDEAHELDHWILLLAGVIAIGIGVALLATTVHACRRAWTSGRLLDRSDRQVPDVLRRLPFVVSAVIALLGLSWFVGSHLRFGAGWLWRELPFFDRASNLTGGVSPYMTLGLFASGAYFWGVTHLRREAAGPPVFSTRWSKRNNAPNVLASCPGIRGEDLAMEFAQFSGRPTTGAPLRWYLFVLLMAVTAYLFAGAPLLTTVDGYGFGVAVAAGSFFLQMAIGLTLFQFLELWRTLDRLLERLARSPLAAAFRRLGRRPGEHLIKAGLMSRLPKIEDLEPLVTAWPTVVAFAKASNGARPLALAAAGEERRLAIVQAPPSDALHPWMKDVARFERRFAGEAREERLHARPWSTSETQPTVLDMTHRLLPILTHHWKQGSSPKHLNAAEDYVATVLVLGIREVLARLGARLAFVMAASLMLLGAFMLYPFSNRQTLVAFAWAFMSIVVAVVLSVFVQVDRSHVLGWLKNDPNAGRFSWDREFLTRAALYGAVPLASLVAAQFPDISRMLFEWLEPVQRVMP